MNRVFPGQGIIERPREAQYLPVAQLDRAPDYESGGFVGSNPSRQTNLKGG